MCLKKLLFQNRIKCSSVDCLKQWKTEGGRNPCKEEGAPQQGGGKWEAEMKKTEKERKVKRRTLEDCTACTSFLLLSLSLSISGLRLILYHLQYLSGLRCSAPLAGFLFVSSKPEQLQETAGGVLLGGGSGGEEAFSSTVVGNHSPNSTYEPL